MLGGDIFLAVYVLSAVAGSVGTFIFGDAVTVGASSGIFGLIGEGALLLAVLGQRCWLCSTSDHCCLQNPSKVSLLMGQHCWVARFGQGIYKSSVGVSICSLRWVDTAGALVAYLYKCKSLSKTGEQLTSIAGVLGFNLVIGSLQETRLDNLGILAAPAKLGVKAAASPRC